MIARLLIYVLLYVCIGGGIVLGGKRLLRGPIEAWQRRRLGKRNLKELEAHKAESCFVCDKPTDPTKDLFHDRRGWYHVACHNELLR